jgi:uncharacterized protein (DUF924 family)
MKKDQHLSISPFTQFEDTKNLFDYQTTIYCREHQLPLKRFEKSPHWNNSILQEALL